MSGVVPVLTSVVWIQSSNVLAWIWLILSVLFFIFELTSLGLTTMWLAASAMAAEIVAMTGAPALLQVIVFVLVSTSLLFHTKGFMKRHLDNRIEKTNAESLINKTAIVMETIDNEIPSGKIKFGDIEWTARSIDETQVIPNGAKVVIREIRGVKCMVEPV